MKALLFAISFVAGAMLPLNARAAADPPPSVRSYHGATIIEQHTGGSPLAGANVFIQAGRDRQTTQQNGIAALVAQTIILTPVNGMPLQTALAGQGGTIRFTVAGSDVRFYVEGMRATFAPDILPLFSAALAKPDFSAATVAAARKELNDKIAENERLALTAGIEMLDRTFYQNSNAGLPQYGSPAVLASQTPEDLRAFYQAHYRREKAIVSAIADPDAIPPDAFNAVVDSLAPGASQRVAESSAPLRSTNRQLIAHRDVNVPWLVAQYRAPSVTSRDFGAMLLLSSFITRTLTDVTELPTIAPPAVGERGVGALYNFDSQPANIIVYVDGGLGDPSRTFATALAVVSILGQTKVQGDIGGMKSYAEGEFVNGATSLEDRTWLAAVFYRESGSAEYLNRSLDAIAHVSVADLQRAARTYLSTPTIALILPRSTPVQQPG
ncbi:MAG: insulinase family protein [Candidatus Eremiobacteraeota bacterium]|nr:insulinase family protein [Candidatus Eremiobacteraeota bacterium]